MSKIKRFFLNNYTAFPSPFNCFTLQQFVFTAQEECLNQSLCGSNVSVMAAAAVSDLLDVSGPLREENIQQLLNIARSCSQDGLGNLVSALQNTGFVYCLQFTLSSGQDRESAIEELLTQLRGIITFVTGSDSLVNITDSIRCPAIPTVNPRSRRSTDDAISLSGLKRRRRNADNNTLQQVAVINFGENAVPATVVCQNTSVVENDSIISCPVCGDGIVHVGTESCDDMNGMDGDGCSDCTIESGFDCDITSSPTVCYIQQCGDEKRVGGEECDAPGGSGCSDTCLILQGFTCIAPFYQRSVCFNCGNKKQEEPEECDNGESDGIDGCSNVCSVDRLWECSGDIGQESSCLHVAVDLNSADNTTLNPLDISFSFPGIVFLVEHPVLLDATRFGNEVSRVCMYVCYIYTYVVYCI